MPWLDHFHPPLSQQRHGESFHAAWASAIADDLNDGLLPVGFFAEEFITVGGRAEIDVAAWEERQPLGNGPVASATRSWTAPPPAKILPIAFPDSFNVQIFSAEGGPRLVGTVELVSPGNKDRDTHRNAFAVKCASYLFQGLGLVVVDMVTSRKANLHKEILRVLNIPEEQLQRGHLYAVGYRPMRQDQREEMGVWPFDLELGEPLPTVPLALSGEVIVPLDLEKTYSDVCRRRIG